MLVVVCPAELQLDPAGKRVALEIERKGLGLFPLEVSMRLLVGCSLEGDPHPDLGLDVVGEVADHRADRFLPVM